MIPVGDFGANVVGKLVGNIFFRPSFSANIEFLVLAIRDIPEFDDSLTDLLLLLLG